MGLSPTCLALLPGSASLLVGQSTTLTVSNALGTITIGNSNNTAVGATLSGNIVTVTGRSAGITSRNRLTHRNSYRPMPGMSSPSEYETLIPHAWKAGSQTQLLRDQLLAMPAGQDVIMTIPKAPYRCPPGPYERACVVADWLKRNKPGSRIIVLDANAGIIVEKDNFNHAFTVTHAGLLNDPQNRPFAPVHVLSYQSKADPLTHVIGDASLTTQPKAGHIGNQQAKTCADAALRLLSKRPPNTPVVTNSACYTPITSTTATWLAAVYQYDSVTQTMVIPGQHNNGSAIAATAATTDNYEDMQTWFKTLMGDTFS